MEMTKGAFRMIEPSSCRFTRNLYKYPHIHGDYELIFCLSGKAVAFIDKEEYVLTSGKGIFVFPNQLHFYNTLETGQFGVLVFKPDIVPTFKDKLSRRIPLNPVFDFFDDSELLAIINSMRCDYDYLADTNFLRLTGYTNFIMDYVYKKIKFTRVSHAEAELFEQIVEYCNQHYKKGIVLADLSKALLVNSNRISKVFGLNMKMGIPQYVESLRFSDACHLLENTDYSIARVSEEAGFGSIRSMNRAFESFLKTTPREYKKIMKQKYK